VVTLARELDLSLVAEGVETEDEIARLKSLNCRYAQGFAFGAAMPGAEFQRRLQAQAGEKAKA
jgi:EAL domain-containing protein (putative c-di-GMP-specific phosphodiesterase class I)